jgi:hypothetical protein
MNYENNEKLDIDFWKTKDGIKPAKDFLINDLTEKSRNAILGKINDTYQHQTFEQLYSSGNKLQKMRECRDFKPVAYELKFMNVSPPVRFLGVREGKNILRLVCGVNSSLSEKTVKKRLIKQYKLLLSE